MKKFPSSELASEHFYTYGLQFQNKFTNNKLNVPLLFVSIAAHYFLVKKFDKLVKLSIQSVKYNTVNVLMNQLQLIKHARKKPNHG